MFGGLSEQVPLRSGVIKSVREYGGDFIRIEESDGTLHAWSAANRQDVHVIVMPEGEKQLFLRTSQTLELSTGRMKQRRMITARLGPAWLHVLDGHLVFGRDRLSLTAVDRQKTQLPPRDGNSWEATPIDGVRLVMKDRQLILTKQGFDA